MDKPPKVLFIDWHKTLSYSFFWSQLTDKNHPHNNYHEIITQWLFKKNSHIIEKWMRGLLSSNQICQQLAIENNLDQKIIFDTLKESAENMQLCSPEIIKIIEDLRLRGIKTIIATDNMDTFRKFTIPSLGLNKIFDDFLISSELGVLKYDIKNNRIPFFDNFLQKNNLNYTDVLLLDDSEEKSGSYKRLGFKISLVKNSEDLKSYLCEYLN